MRRWGKERGASGSGRGGLTTVNRRRDGPLGQYSGAARDLATGVNRPWEGPVVEGAVRPHPKMKTKVFRQLFFRRAPFSLWIGPLESKIGPLRPKIGPCVPGMDLLRYVN